MKTEEKQAEEATRQKVWEKNLIEEARLIIRTIVLVGRDCSMNEIARILRGDQPQYFRDPNHASLETTGSLTRVPRLELRLIMSHLLDEGFLNMNNPDYQAIGVTDQGLELLEEPRDLMVDEIQVTMNPYDHYVHRKLRMMRSELAKKQNIPVYEVLSDYTIDQLTKELPETLKELALLEGMSEAQLENYGAKALETLDACNRDWNRVKNLRVLRKTMHFTHQEVKRLFKEGFGIEEISGILGIKIATVESYLGDFHKVGEIDLRPWIENYLDQDTLDKGVTYFKDHPSSKLREAKARLGIEYNLLHLTRLYAEGFCPAPVAVSA